MLLDSNIFIYSILPQFVELREWVLARKIWASDITRLEVLGYHQLNEQDRCDLISLFDMAIVYPVSPLIIQQAIEFRQQRKMSLGDSIIAATALQYQQTLVTRNTADFMWVSGLKVIDPFV